MLQYLYSSTAHYDGAEWLSKGTLEEIYHSKIVAVLPAQARSLIIYHYCLKWWFTDANPDTYNFAG